MLAAVILGSGAAFLESSVVTVALPEIGRDLDLELGGLQWVMNAYLLALSALIITGGSLGDLYGRRIVFVIGLIGFAATSLLCALAPSGEVLIVARILQGVTAALLVPASLAIVEASFAEEDRGKAIGAWAGWSGISSLIGPFLGGFLVDNASWRWVFAIVVVVALIAAWIGARHLPESRAQRSRAARPDWTGSVLVSLGLAGLTYALVEAGGGGLGDAGVLFAGVAGVALLIAFVLFERRTSDPMLPLDIFRSRQFSGANAATLANYLAIGALFFFLSLQLQNVLGYSALEAGAATFPATVIMLVLSPQAGALGQRIGPRIPMTVGPVVLGAGLVLLSGVERGDDYVSAILPGVIVFGFGMTIFVAPLTAAVLGALTRRAGRDRLGRQQRRRAPRAAVRGRRAPRRRGPVRHHRGRAGRLLRRLPHSDADRGRRRRRRWPDRVGHDPRARAAPRALATQARLRRAPRAPRSESPPAQNPPARRPAPEPGPARACGECRPIGYRSGARKGATMSAEDHGPSIKDDELYEELREEGESKEKAARIANKAGGEDVSRKGGEAEDYEERTKEELEERAAEIGIEGRSEMSKDELISALRNH